MSQKKDPQSTVSLYHFESLLCFTSAYRCRTGRESRSCYYLFPYYLSPGQGAGEGEGEGAGGSARAIRGSSQGWNMWCGSMWPIDHMLPHHIKQKPRHRQRLVQTNKVVLVMLAGRH